MPGPTHTGGSSATPAPTAPTSSELIQADVDAGKIDEPTALLYRLYAMFGDSRLPTAYAGRWSEDGAALDAADQELDNLPAPIAAELRPFLARPTDPISVFNQAQTGQSAQPPAPLAPSGPTGSLALGMAVAQVGNPFGPGDFACQPNGWGFIDSGTVTPGPGWRLWTLCGDQAALTQLVSLAGWMPRFYADETALMGPAMSDVLGGPAEAGDGPIDIYFVNQCASAGGRCLSAGFDDASEFGFAKPARPCVPAGAATKCSGFAVVNRANFDSDTPSTLAHEFFHVLEFAHNRSGLSASGHWNWFTEASAKWAQFHYYPPSRPGRVYRYFNSFMSTGLGLAKTNGYNEYASFVWPLFMTESGPSGDALIGAAWRAIEGQSGEQAVNKAISSVLPFDENFRDFAVTAWNEPLTHGTDPINPHFWDLDGQLPMDPPSGPKYRLEDLPAKKRSDPPLSFPVTMPPLSARYADLFPDEKVKQVTVNFTGIAPDADFDVDALLDIKDKGWERRELVHGDTHFCLTDPPDAVQEFIIVLSNHDAAANVSGDWTVESLAEPCGAWDVVIDWTDVYDNVPDTIHFVGQVDTVDLTVPTDDETLYMTGGGTASGARGGWKGCNPGIDETPQGSGKAIFQAIITNSTITVSAFADIDNPLAGVSTDIFEATLEDAAKAGGATVIIDPRQPFGDPCPHYSYGAATITARNPTPPAPPGP